MANALLTINMITREALRLWKNTNSFIKHIDQQYDDSFAQTGAKIGSALRIRLPNDYVVRTGPTASPQDTAEQSTTLTLATQKGVDVSFNSVDRALSLDDYSKRVLAPMVNNLIGAVALDVMSGVEGGISNFVANQDAALAISSPSVQTFLNSGAYLDMLSAPRGNRLIVLDKFTQARTVANLAGLFNPSRKISDQFDSGEMQQALGFDWLMDQTVLSHTTGTYVSASGTVSGANQTGTSIVTAAIAGTLAVGDIIYFAGVYAVNRITKQTEATLAQFVVTSSVVNGATSISIYPAIVPPVNGNVQQYQTVSQSPANGATIGLVTAASAIYRKNFAFSPEAVTLATADLELPKGVHEAHREAYDGVSMRMVSAYDVKTDQFITRLDVLYGYKWVRPEWACVIADLP